MLSKVKTLFATAVLILSGYSFANAEQISYPGFTGNINTTLTTGLSMRVGEDCLALTGFQDVAGDTTFATAVNSNRSADASVLLGEYEPGCGKVHQDGYGNPVDLMGPRRELISGNADDGRMNFRDGDIFDATTRVYTEIDGTFDNGLGMKASFVGSYNPLTSFTNPTWAPFTNAALDDIETNVDILDLYVVQDIDELDATITAGRFVTNWGESTFIPIGMNGLTTNAIDLQKLRVPGSSIKEALVPANQITLSGYLDGGLSYEAYVQMDESHVELDPNGSFFGNEVASGDRLTFTSPYGQNSQQQSSACSFLNSMPGAAGGAAKGCTQDAIDHFNSAAGKLNTAMYMTQAGLNSFVGAASTNATDLIIKAGILGGGAAAASSIGGTSASINSLTGLGATGIAGLAAGYAAFNEYDLKQARKAGALDASGGNHIYADGKDQYGLALRTYLDNVGTGVDLGFYFAQYDSKQPYLQFEGKRGVYAGDLLGLYTIVAECSQDGDPCAAGGAFMTASDYYSASGVPGAGDSAITELTTGEAAGMAQLMAALSDTAYGEAACGAYMNPEAADELYNSGASGTAASNFGFTSAQKANALTYYNYTVINGKMYHDSTKCYDNANANSGVPLAIGLGTGQEFDTAGTQAAAAALLGAAVQPLNSATYHFVYPENLKAIGFSANTNVNGTTVQAEITYRPDFPLATNGGDQGQQLSDAGGTTSLLSIGVAQSVRTACRNAYMTDLGIGDFSELDATTQATIAAATDTVLEIAALGTQYKEGSNAALFPNTTAKCALQQAATAAYRAGNADADAEWADVVKATKDFKRSSLPAISLATVAAGNYTTTPYLEHDVITGTIGTTTTFTASHPITTGLMADSSVLLTEIGFVAVTDLDYTRGGINRGGYRDGVGGAKCGGVTNGGGAPTTYNAARILDAATHLGSSQTDPLFGNGSYCESQNTIDDNSYTYRIIGSATYNNIANSAWTFAPSFVWSHDVSGYGPTSLGGFVPGKQSLSLSGNLTKGDVKVGVNYVNQMGDEKDNLNYDKDYVSASVSYAF